MTHGDLLNRARAELLRTAPDCLARGPESALLLSLDGDDEPVVDVFTLADIAVITWTSCDEALDLVRLESVPLARGEVRVFVMVDMCSLTVSVIRAGTEQQMRAAS